MISIRLSIGGEMSALLPAGDHGALAPAQFRQLLLGEAGAQPGLSDQLATTMHTESVQRIPATIPIFAL